MSADRPSARETNTAHFRVIAGSAEIPTFVRHWIRDAADEIDSWRAVAGGRTPDELRAELKELREKLSLVGTLCRWSKGPQEHAATIARLGSIVE